MQHGRWQQNVTVTLLICVVAGVGCKDSADGQARYQTAPVVRGAVASWVTATGAISPVVTVQVGSQVSGRIQALMVDFNDAVRRGQVIAQLDPVMFRSQVAQARANLEVAKAGVVSAEAKFQDAERQQARSAELAQKSLVSQAEAESALTAKTSAAAEIVSAKARLTQAEAALEQAQINLAYTTVVSPIDGIVISRNVDVGQTVAASFQAPTLFVIAEDLRKMEVHTSVAEADVARLKAEMTVEFNVDAHPGRVFRGQVKEVRFAATTLQNVVTYDAVVSVANPDLSLRPGMTAEVRFLVAEAEAALTVPNAALRFKPATEAKADSLQEMTRPGRPAPMMGEPGPPSGADATPGAKARVSAPRNKRTVWRLDAAGLPQAVAVEIGISDGKVTAIEAGALNEGDLVIIGADGADTGKKTQRPPFGRLL